MKPGLRAAAMAARGWAAVFLVLCATVPAMATTWTGGGDGTDWFDGANWDSGLPGAGDDAVIASGSVLLTNDTAELASLAITNATLTFSNSTTRLIASNVVILSGATVTHVSNTATDTNAFGEWPINGRVHIVCTGLEVRAQGTIDVSGKGFMGATGDGSSSPNNGYGPGLGQTWSSAYYGGGGGYGGKGGNGGYGSIGGSVYGLTNAPVSVGSGGGGRGAGSGGGALRIEASGDVVIDGIVTADGQDGVTWGSGGSGGSIYITCRTITGSSNGFLTAQGGSAGIVQHAASGGGGRIAVVYDPAAQAGTPLPSVRFNTANGPPNPSTLTYRGNTGTLYVPDTALFRTDLSTFEDVRLYGATNWAVDRLDVTNSRVALADFVALTVTNTMTLNNSHVKLGDHANRSVYRTLQCDSLYLTNEAALTVYAGPTNAVTTNFGARVLVGSEIVVASNSWIYPVSEGTNGGSVLFSVRDVRIQNGGGINADQLGYNGGTLGVAGSGPGGGEVTSGSASYGGGGGYGGKGGSGTQGAGGSPYPWTNAPISAGSGGGGNAAGRGGGLVWIKASGTIMIDGTISANGGDGSTWGGGGSGGGILIVGSAIEISAGGLLSATGGDRGGVGSAGGGGGGRIAIWYRVPESDQQTILSDPNNAQANVPRIVITNDLDPSGLGASWTVTNGLSRIADADPGTAIYLTVLPPNGMVFTAF